MQEEMAAKAGTTPPNTDHRGKKIYDLKSDEAREIMAKQKMQGYTADFGYVEKIDSFDLYIPVPEVRRAPWSVVTMYSGCFRWGAKVDCAVDVITWPCNLCSVDLHVLVLFRRVYAHFGSFLCGLAGPIVCLLAYVASPPPLSAWLSSLYVMPVSLCVLNACVSIPSSPSPPHTLPM